MNEESVVRISGFQIAGDPYQAIRDIAEAFENIDISAYTLRDLHSFEEVAVALYILKYKTLVSKNKDYGKNSIKQGDIVKVLERLGEKVERAKNLVGDPVNQMTKVKTQLDNLPDDATMEEMLKFVSSVHNIIYPRTKVNDEAPEDTLMDASNYADICFQLLLGVWNKPYMEDVE